MPHQSRNNTTIKYSIHKILWLREAAKKKKKSVTAQTQIKAVSKRKKSTIFCKYGEIVNGFLKRKRIRGSGIKKRNLT